MQLYYLCFFQNQNWDVPKISAYLEARQLINRVNSTIIEDKVFSLYKVYSHSSKDAEEKINSGEFSIFKYTLDNVIYCFINSSKVEEIKTEIKHDIL